MCVYLLLHKITISICFEMESIICPILCSCGPAQLAAIVMVPYHLACATKCKLQLAFYNYSNDPNTRTCLELEIERRLCVSEFLTKCAVPVIGTLWAIDSNS